MSITEDQILRAWFESGPDGYPGRFDQVAESVKDRNRPRARAILMLLGEGAALAPLGALLEAYQDTKVEP